LDNPFLYFVESFSPAEQGASYATDVGSNATVNKNAKKGSTGGHYQGDRCSPENFENLLFYF
jgi:hypothetical protein